MEPGANVCVDQDWVPYSPEFGEGPAKTKGRFWVVRQGHVRTFRSSGRKKADRWVGLWGTRARERPPDLELVSWPLIGSVGVFIDRMEAKCWVHSTWYVINAKRVTAIIAVSDYS